MPKKKIENSFLIVSAVMAVILGIYCLFIAKPYIAKRKQISAEIAQKTKELELFREEKGGISSEELIEILKTDSEDYQKKIKFLKEYLGDFDVTLPPEVTQKGLFFKEKAYQSERRLRKEAEKKNIALPISLGFDKDVPTEEEAERLLWKLVAIEKIVETLIESGMNTLVSLNLKPAVEHSDAGIVYTDIPIEIKCRGKTISLLHFVHSLSKTNYPLFVEKMDIRKKSQPGEKEKLEIDFTIQGIDFH